jgi:hypothetical protein
VVMARVTENRAGNKILTAKVVVMTHYRKSNQSNFFLVVVQFCD